MAFIYTVQSDKDSHFTGAIAQNAGESENLVLPGCLEGIRGNARSILRAIAIESDENLDWEIWLFRKDAFQVSDLDTDSWVGRWSFVAADAVRLAGAGQYLYYIDGLAVPYFDADNTGELHVTLINRSAAGKTAGAAGEIVVKFFLEPMGE